MGTNISQVVENRVMYILHKLRRSLERSNLTLFINKKNVFEGSLFLEKVQKRMKMEYFMVNLMR
jgi:hypothetical protein